MTSKGKCYMAELERVRFSAPVFFGNTMASELTDKTPVKVSSAKVDYSARVVRVVVTVRTAGEDRPKIVVVPFEAVESVHYDNPEESEATSGNQKR